MTGMLRFWKRGRTGTTFHVARAVKYSACIAASTVSMFYPSVIIHDAFRQFEVFAYAWSAILLVGSLICLAGIVTKTWVGEYIGLWGVIASLVLYGLGCFIAGPNFSGSRIFLGLLILGFAASAFARHQDVTYQKRLADYENRARAGRPGL